MTNLYKNLSENESTMDSSTTHQSSVIYVPSTGLSIEDWLASQAEVSHVSRIPKLEKDRENMTQETFGQLSESALARWEASSSCWRTSQGCLFPLTEDPRDMLQPLLGSFPNSGMTVDGVLYLLPPLVPRISDGDGGASVWQTPTVTSIPPRSEEALVRKKAVRNKSGRHTVPPGTLEEQVVYSPNEGDAPIWDMLKAHTRWATPTTMDSIDTKSQERLDHELTNVRPGRSQPNRLADQVAVQQGERLWATPTTQDFAHKDMVVNENNRRVSKTTDTNRGLNLQDQVSMWPTPRASDVEGGTVTDVELHNGSFSRTNKDGVRWGVKLRDAASAWPTPNTRDTRRGCNQKQLATEVDKWPTPTEDDSSNVNPKPNRRPGLVSRVNDKEKEKWPTPTTSDHKGWSPGHNRADDPNNRLDFKVANMEREANKWPTPTASEGTKGSTRANYGQVRLSNHPNIVGYPDRDKMNKSQLGDKTRTATTAKEADVEEKPHGQLNPSWVAWLMGLPPGWESLEPVSREDYDTWFDLHMDDMWWAEERGLPRVGVKIPDRVNRLKACGNGIVPSCVAAFLRLI